MLINNGCLSSIISLQKVEFYNSLSVKPPLYVLFQMHLFMWYYLISKVVELGDTVRSQISQT